MIPPWAAEEEGEVVAPERSAPMLDREVLVFVALALILFLAMVAVIPSGEQMRDALNITACQEKHDYCRGHSRCLRHPHLLLTEHGEVR